MDQGINLQCIRCKKEFQRKLHLEQHMRTHTGQKPYTCELCRKQFSIKCNLKQHLKRHLKPRPVEETFPCSYEGCKFSTTRKVTLVLHESAHRPETNVANIPSNDQKIKIRWCTICEKHFKYVSSFNRHMTSHKGERAFQCDICSKAFIQKDHLKTHMKTHLREKAPFCFQNTEQNQRTSCGEKNENRDTFERPSTSSQTAATIESGEIASEEIIFTWDKCEEFLENVDIDAEIMQLERDSQVELFAEFETKENNPQCQFCQQKFNEEESLKEHETKYHRSQ
ncbi:zinc finger protein 182-like [Centruroides sculpturatus]|uniref:zinc finger protein 182-like n=1 Tax=Centruroides sculpturatus TaxID=218467 RepID=UPI000C6CC9BD|nr:zinc finger protein 182-like [Centruroides sculpturatus]